MKNGIPVALFAFVPILMFVPSHAPAQEPSEGVRKVVNKVVPQYPGLARSMNPQGVVRADVLVAPTARLSTSVKGGHPVLADAAQNALRQWKWVPAPRETSLFLNDVWNGSSVARALLSAKSNLAIQRLGIELRIFGC